MQILQMWGIVEEPWETSIFRQKTYPFGFYRENPFLLWENPIPLQPGKSRRICRRNTRGMPDYNATTEDVTIPVRFDNREKSSARKSRSKPRGSVETRVDEPCQQSVPAEMIIPVGLQQSKENVADESVGKENEEDMYSKGNVADESTNDLEEHTVEGKTNEETKFGDETDQSSKTADAVMSNIKQDHETHHNEQQQVLKTEHSTDSRSPDMEQKLNGIETQLANAGELSQRVKAFQGSKQDKEYVYLEEMLTRCILSLDLIDTEGFEEVKTSRRAAIKEILSLVTELESRVVTS